MQLRGNESYKEVCRIYFKTPHQFTLQKPYLNSDPGMCRIEILLPHQETSKCLS